MNASLRLTHMAAGRARRARWTAAVLPLPLPLMVMLGLVWLYAPIYWRLADTFWPQAAYGHGPYIAMASAVLLWRERARLAALPAPVNAWPGAMVLAMGLAFAWLGQSRDIALLSTVSQLPVLAGVVLLLHGTAGLRLVAFALLYLLFMVPVPGLLLNALTLDLKELVSTTTVHLLQALHYPVARSGVIIVLGHYQMLVADACSGLHSLVSLSALGLLYIRLQGQLPRWHRWMLALAVLPVALAANVLRTLALLLITFHAGDVSARAWHDTTGIALFLLALAMLFGIDHGLTKLERRARRRATGQVERVRS